jgi:hypothetical protein
MMLKPAVFAPIPMVSVSTAVMVNPGAFHNWRMAYCRSCNKFCRKVRTESSKGPKIAVLILPTIAQFDAQIDVIGKWLISGDMRENNRQWPIPCLFAFGNLRPQSDNSGGSERT